MTIPIQERTLTVCLKLQEALNDIEDTHDLEQVPLSVRDAFETTCMILDDLIVTLTQERTNQ